MVSIKAKNKTEIGKWIKSIGVAKQKLEKVSSSMDERGNTANEGDVISMLNDLVGRFDSVTDALESVSKAKQTEVKEFIPGPIENETDEAENDSENESEVEKPKKEKRKRGRPKKN